MDALLATITEYAGEASLFEVLGATVCALLLIALMSLGVQYWRLRKRYAKAEAELFERTVGTQSRNWTNTAQSLEKKAKSRGYALTAIATLE